MTDFQPGDRWVTGQGRVAHIRRAGDARWPEAICGYALWRPRPATDEPLCKACSKAARIEQVDQ